MVLHTLLTKKDYIDIYKEVSGLKFLLKLPDYKQKTIERFLGLSRMILFPEVNWSKFTRII